MMAPCTQPLSEKRVLIACSEQKMPGLIEELSPLGAEIIPLQVISIREIADKAPISAALTSLENYDWIVFTSSYGVLFFARCMQAHGITPEQLGQPRVCAVGPATAASARRQGFDVALVPEEYVAEGILEALSRHYGGFEQLTGRRFLLPRAKEARDVLPSRLTEAGAHVDVVPCYETTASKLDQADLHRISERPPDLLVFTSSSTVRNFVTLLGAEDRGRRLLNSTVSAALGPITAKTVESFGKKCEIVPRENTIEALVQAIRAYFADDR